MVEPVTSYVGDQPSAMSFFYQWRAIIFRRKGSVVPFVLIEILIAIGLSFLALHICPDEEIDTIGHQLVGVLLAFLLVFRSQVKELNAGCRSLLDPHPCLAHRTHVCCLIRHAAR